MRNTLSAKINKSESGIVNLDSVINPGTHWVCYKKRGAIVVYFTIHGDLRLPRVGSS